MIIDCIADLHGHYPKLEGGDLLIVAGDCTSNNSIPQWMKFFGWFLEQDYKKKVLVAGNHDNFLTTCSTTETAKKMGIWSGENYEYLCDSGTEFEGLKIWGSPWTLTFPGINPPCTAFTGTEADLEAKFKLIPDDTDILVTHGPPYGILDEVYREVFCGGKDECVGSESLLKRVFEVRPKVNVFGHIHEGFGEYFHKPREGSSEALGITAIKFINCSHVNERYQPVNKAVRVVL